MKNTTSWAGYVSAVILNISILLPRRPVDQIEVPRHQIVNVTADLVVRPLWQSIGSGRIQSFLQFRNTPGLLFLLMELLKMLFTLLPREHDKTPNGNGIRLSFRSGSKFRMDFAELVDEGPERRCLGGGGTVVCFYNDIDDCGGGEVVSATRNRLRTMARPSRREELTSRPLEVILIMPPKPSDRFGGFA